MAGTIAASPTLLSVFDGMRRAVGGETFNPVHREIAGVAVGVAVDNAYGVAFHSTVLSRLGVADAEIEAIRAGNAPTDPTHAAVTRSPERLRSIAAQSRTRSSSARWPLVLIAQTFCSSLQSVSSRGSSASWTTSRAVSSSTSSCCVGHGGRE